MNDPTNYKDVQKNAHSLPHSTKKEILFFCEKLVKRLHEPKKTVQLTAMVSSSSSNNSLPDEDALNKMKNELKLFKVTKEFQKNERSLLNLPLYGCRGNLLNIW